MEGFGNASQFAAGGFMQSADQGTATQPQSGVGDDAGGVDTLRCLTVAQLKQAQETAQPDDSFMADGRRIKNVSIVGLLMSRSFEETKILFNIYDGTGVITANIFLESAEQREKYGSYEDNTYVRVFGSWSGATTEHPDRLGSINAFTVQPVEDHNEVVHWNLQVIFQHVFLMAGRDGKGAALPSGMAAAPAPGGSHAYGAPQMMQGAQDARMRVITMAKEAMGSNANWTVSMSAPVPDLMRSLQARDASLTNEVIYDALQFAQENGYLLPAANGGIWYQD